MPKLFSIIMAILSVLTVPIMILNFLGGIVGGVWLAALGQWSLVLYGLAVIFFGHFIVSLLLAPGMLLAMPSIWAFNKNHLFLGGLLALPTVLWTYVLLAFWCTASFAIMFFYMKGEHLFPTLLWAYAVATSPWTYLAQFEARNDPNASAVITSFGAQLGCVFVMIDIFVNDSLPPLIEVIVVLGIPLVVAFFVQAAIAVLSMIEERRYRAG